MKTTACMKVPGRACRFGAVLVCLWLASGCAALRPVAAPRTPAFYSLDNARAVAPAGAASALPAAGPTLIVNTPRAAAGFDSQRIIYVRRPHTFEYFAHSEWIDTPARMLTPLIVAAVEASGAFRAVVQAPSSAGGGLRLETEVLQLQQEFDDGPSRVRFALRVYLVEDATRRIVASRDIESVAAAPSEDPYGGVIAANQAVGSALKTLSAFCAEAAGNWRAGGGEDAAHRSGPL